jgi:uncharacterized Ntn-hydrolase superfamily protein
MTFSIVAVDREKGETGFAISSCSWDSGQVGLAKAEIGAIVSQARGNMIFRTRFFEKLGEGMNLNQIFQHFREIDDDIEYRQVGMIKQDGEPLSFTGKRCSYWAGHKTGENFACQGNILVGPEVLENMVKAFSETQGDLLSRLYAALQAGDNAGGDARGKQSARVYVVSKSGWIPGEDMVIDITVEDHVEPVKEVGRIINAGRTMLQTFQFTMDVDNSTGEDKLIAMRRLEEYLHERVDRVYVDAWSTLASAQLELGLREKAVSSYRTVLEMSPNMVELFKRRIESQELPAEILR